MIILQDLGLATTALRFAQRRTTKLDTYGAERGASGAKSLLPSRLHHNAYVTRDIEATRHFYEDVLGFALVATWCEADELFGALRVYCHCFFAIGDGGALAFFQFADPQDQERFGPRMPFTPFHHIAFKVDAETQAQIRETSCGGRV